MTHPQLAGANINEIKRESLEHRISSMVPFQHTGHRFHAPRRYEPKKPQPNVRCLSRLFGVRRSALPRGTNLASARWRRSLPRRPKLFGLSSSRLGLGFDRGHGGLVRGLELFASLLIGERLSGAVIDLFIVSHPR